MNLRKPQVIIGVAILFVIILALTFAGFSMKDDQEGAEKAVYVDKGSGETIIKDSRTPQGTDESFENLIIYPGFSKLIDRGLTTVQIQSIQNIITQYSLKQPEEKRFKEVSLATDSFTKTLPRGGSKLHQLTFTITVNRTDPYHVVTEYTDMQTIRTKIYTSDKTTLLIEG